MHHYYPDPTDPTKVFYNPLPDDATQEDIELYQRIMLKTMLRGFLMFIVVLALLALMSLFTGCTTPKVVTVERVRTDTVRITQYERDSIFRHDSIYVRERTQGDTVLLEVDRWHTQYRDRWRTDTAYISRHDSVPVPYPVEQLVPAPLTQWQQLQIWLGRLVLVALALCATVWLLKKYIKSRLKPPLGGSKFFTFHYSLFT